jgi:DNA-binding FadR family transcriptional regulator
MKDHKWLLACLALLAGGLVAGCGGGGDTTTAPSATAAGETTTTSTATEASGSASPDDVYQACLDAVEGTAAEAAAQKACANARDAFEQCTTQASNAPEGEARDAALKACQEAADKATAALNAAP